MKLALNLAGALFMTGAALQYNDSNSGLWIAMYLATAVLSWLAAGKWAPAKLLASAAVACLAIAGWTASIEFNNPGCRIGTDIPGPAVCACWLAWLAWMARARPLVVA